MIFYRNQVSLRSLVSEDVREIQNMPHDLYESFAERYDLFFNKFGEHDSAVVEFFSELFEGNQVHSVLDCACGTGQDLHLFYSLGYEVFGSDISLSMLAQAQKNLNECGIKIPLTVPKLENMHTQLKSLIPSALAQKYLDATHNT